jgi:hypothetical protein
MPSPSHSPMVDSRAAQAMCEAPIPSAAATLQSPSPADASGDPNLPCRHSSLPPQLMPLATPTYHADTPVSLQSVPCLTPPARRRRRLAGGPGSAAGPQRTWHTCEAGHGGPSESRRRDRRARLTTSVPHSMAGHPSHDRLDLAERGRRYIMMLDKVNAMNLWNVV